MKKTIITSVLLSFISGNAMAANGYDNCVKAEKALKTQETSDCSGIRYLLNPSACFKTRKALEDYSSGKCKKIGITENVNFSTQPNVPEMNVTSDTSTKQKINAPESLRQETSFDQLKEENNRLKAEIKRLNAENEQLRNSAR